MNTEIVMDNFETRSRIELAAVIIGVAAALAVPLLVMGAGI